MHTSLTSAKQLAQNLDNPNWRIVDCRFSLDAPERGRRDYQQTHIPNAIYANLNDDLSAPVIPGKTGRHPLPKVDDLTKLFSQWGIDENVQVVAYDDATGAIAARLWWLLRWLGHEKAAVLDGGWQRWSDHGYPKTARLPEYTARTFTPRLQADLVVDTEKIEKVFDAKNFLLVDSRSPERFTGKHEPIDPVAGHIPDAVNVPYSENLDASGNFLDRDKLRQRFEDVLGEFEAENSIFYCGSGVTACHNLLALHHAGLGDAKLYAGSWSEWITVSGRPIVSQQKR